MTIEMRSKQHRSLSDRDGSVVAVYQERPLAKIVLPQKMPALRAVCVNGKWFVESIESLQKLLEEDWEDAS